MAIICRDRGLLFILAPHTASTAIATLLQDDFAGEWIPAEQTRYDGGRAVVKRKHTTEPELMASGLVSPEERARLLAFCAVRNPFDALVSTYLKHAVKDQAKLESPDAWVHGSKRKLANLEYCRDHTFDEWIAHSLQPRLRDRIRGRVNVPRMPHDEGVDVVMRYERLQEDLDGVFAKAGIEGRHQIPEVNTTSARAGRDYRDFYCKLSRRLVEKAYADYLSRYGY